MKLLFFVLLLLPSLTFAHNADNFCERYRTNGKIPNIEAYEKAGLIGGAYLAEFNDGSVDFVHFASQLPEVKQLMTDGIEHCQEYLPELCHDDLEFMVLIKEYWHWRRTLEDQIKLADQSRMRGFIYAHMRGSIERRFIPVPFLHYDTDALEFQRDFVDYWQRITRYPDVEACIKMRRGEWKRSDALAAMEAHILAAKIHLQKVIEKRALLAQFETDPNIVVPLAWCPGP